MNVVRSLERRLERLLEGVAGRVFSGRLHPAEIAGRLAREADFARFEQPTGPSTANLYTLVVNPKDLNTDPSRLENSLAAELDRYTTEQGLRLEGPCRVVIGTSDKVPAGTVQCHVEVVPGPQVAWARLVSGDNSYELGRNRAQIGRADTVDTVLPFDDISRRHAMIWREGGRSWITDLGSANGTTVDGVAIAGEPVEIRNGSMVGMASHRLRFLLI